MILALCGALAIGLTLGLLGAGGSILTVPILVFLLQHPEKQAIVESLFIVSVVSFAGALPYAWRHQIHWRSVVFFGVPGIIGASIGSYGAHFLSGSMQLTLFALMMCIVAIVMLMGPLPIEKIAPVKNPVWLIIGQGLLVGMLTGLICIGGGFLIVPALLIFEYLSMPVAIGTSLVIIAMNALTGFMYQYLTLENLHIQISWETISIISVVGIIGSLIGSIMGKKIPQMRLKQAFGVSVLLMGVYILTKQI